jgi:hypothetical protein
MLHHRIVTFVPFTALIVLLAGCAAQSPGAGSGVSDRVTTAAMTPELTGTWRGWFNIAGGEYDRQGTLALEIKDDGTYRLTWTRKGVPSDESGVVVAKADRVILKSASGQSMTLMRKGGTLHGLSLYPGGHPIMVTVERVPATTAGSDSQGSGSPAFAPGPERSPILNPIQTP